MKTNEANQFHLMTRKRFLPMFLTQFLGAFNDNIFKNALVLMIVYQVFASFSANSDLLVNLAAGLFILPFFIFSPLAGQVADKFEQSMLIRRIKQLEILIMAGAAAALYFKSMTGLLILLFLMGTQSAFFGPVKYAILPRHLKSEELVGGNGLIEMGTFVAILLGTILAGLLIQFSTPVIIGLVLIGVAVAGWVASRKIPEAKSQSPDLVISLNQFKQIGQTLKIVTSSKGVLAAIVAVSWFWFLGAAYLTQFPKYTRTVLNGSESVVTLLLACFSIGIGVGSLLCEQLSGKKVELGLVPFGILGITLFGLDLYWAYPSSHLGAVLGIRQFLFSDGSFRVIADLIFIGVCGGFYTVPLYAFIQTRVSSKVRARTVAANNIINAVFMVVSALFAIICLSFFKISILQFFLVLAIVNGIFAIAVLSRTFGPFVWFLVRILSSLMYRIHKRGNEYIPQTGAAVIISNHVSFVDWLLISAACRRPVRFVMYAPIFKIPGLNFIFRWVKAIPIDSAKTNPRVYHTAFEKIDQALKDGDLVCIFPEGKLTQDGSIDEFKGGIKKIVQDTDIPVIPMAIQGMWGSFFSHKGGKALAKFPRRFFSRVGLNVGSPVRPCTISSLELLRNRVIRLSQASI